jgi:peptide/nickel transport system permease protein
MGETKGNGIVRFIRSNRMLVSGLVVMFLLLLFSLGGGVVVTRDQADVGAGRPSKPPTADHLLGTDQQGRDVLADLMFGTPASLKIGLIAGVLGVSFGALLGLIAGYFGGTVDAIIRLVTDVFLTIPSLLILVVIASLIHVVSIEAMGLLIAGLAWMWPTRTVRAQVLSIRERMYVQVARLGGMSDAKIIVYELLPNLLPYLAASLVGTISGAILVAIGLSTLGLGPQNEPSLGLTIYWAIYYGALIRQLWWWFLPPILIIVFVFLGLFMITAGLDRIANPRLRTTV